MRIRGALLAVAASALVVACAGRDSPQARLDTFLAQAVAAAQERDTGDLMELVAEDYQDAQGRDKGQLRNYVRGLFLRFGSIHLDSRIVEIRQLEESNADIELSLGMAGPRGDANPLWTLGARRYRVRLELVAEGPSGPFRLLRASWQPEQD
jgi:hypothetical protein